MKTSHSFFKTSALALGIILLSGSSLLIPQQAHAMNVALINPFTNIPTPALCGGMWSSDVPGIGTLQTIWSYYGGSGTDPLCTSSNPSGIVTGTGQISPRVMVNYFDSSLHNVPTPIHDDQVSANRVCYLLDPTSVSTAQDFHNYTTPHGSNVEWWDNNNPSICPAGSNYAGNGGCWRIDEASSGGNINGVGYNRYSDNITCTTTALPASTLSASATSVLAGTPVTLSWDDGPNADAEGTVSTPSGFSVPTHTVYPTVSVQHNVPPNQCITTTIVGKVGSRKTTTCGYPYPGISGSPGFDQVPSGDPVNPPNQVPNRNGSVTVTPSVTTQYCYSSTNDKGTTKNCVTVTIVPPAQPNLTSATGPTVSAVMGSATTLTGTASNIGTAAAGSFPNIIQVCDGGCATINTTIAANQISSLGVNASAPISASYTPTVVGNQLYYRTCADTNTSWQYPASESNYADNCGGWTNLNVSPPVPAIPTNPVTTCSPDGHSVSFSWSPSQYATNYYPRMYAPGGSQCTSFGWQVWTGDNLTCYPNPDNWTQTSVTNFPVTPGQNYAWWTQSANGSGTNNQTTGNGSFTCNAPDLTAGAITPTSAATGVPVTLSASISNGGSAASGSFPSIFEINGPSTVVQTSYGSVGANSSAPFTASYTFNTPGSYQVRACANLNSSWTNIVTESNYGNNCGPWQTVTVATPAVSCTPSPNTALTGQNITWTPNPSGFSGTPSYIWTGVGGYGTPSSGSGATFTNSYSASGNYGVHVVATLGGQTANADCSAVTISPTTVTVTATPNRVKTGSTSGVNVSWTSNATTGTCSVSNNNDSTVWTSAPSGGSNVDSNPINAQTTYTATCNSVTGTAVVNVTPTFTNF
jgi:hypothetical protein